MNYTFQIYEYIDEIPKDVWGDLSCTENTYLSKPYLKALEKYNSNKIQFYYIVVFNAKEAIAIATIQIIEFDIQANDLSVNAGRLVQKMSHYINCLLKQNYIKLVICGNAFLSGENGIYIKHTENKKKVLETIVRSTQNLINSDKYLKKWVDIILLKDFVATSLPITNSLKKYNYSSINVDPNMVLALNPSWNTFEDYLKAFKSKFRVKAKKAYKVSASLVEKDFDPEEIAKYKPALTQLYHNVRDKASFNPETLNLSTYVALKKELKEEFIFKGYFLGEELVGFMSGVVNKQTLDAHYVGLNYTLNKEHAIYSRILYDYVKIGIALNLEAINFGRTAGEIKSTLGAKPQELTCYIRHKKSVTNFLFKPLTRKIKPKPFEQRYPFKEAK